MLWRAFFISLLISFVLSVINQWPVFTDFGDFSAIRFFLTCIVLFFALKLHHLFEVTNAEHIELEQKSSAEVSKASEIKEPVAAPVVIEEVQSQSPTFSDDKVSSLRAAQQIITDIAENARKINTASVERKELINIMTATSGELNDSLNAMREQTLANSSTLGSSGKEIETVITIAARISERTSEEVKISSDITDRMNIFAKSFAEIEELANSIA